ncbi:MAG: hypothetical protein U0R78_15405 [Nocardioidaceae bacterium]
MGPPGVLPISGLCAHDGAEGSPGRRPPSSRQTTAAARLDDAFPVLYRGDAGLVAHECILDVRGITKETGVSADDVAKRLIDYGFHAPTMSFPVAGSSWSSLPSRRVSTSWTACDAMIAIRGEIDRVAAGE